MYDRQTHSTHSILKVNKEGRTRTIFTLTNQGSCGESSFLTLDDKKNVIFHMGSRVLQVMFNEAQLFRFQLSTVHRWNRLLSSSFSSQDNKKVLLFLLCMEILGGVDHHQRQNKKKKGKIESIIRHAQDSNT